MNGWTQTIREPHEVRDLSIKKGARPMAPPKPRRRPGFTVTPRP
jgi:hypothetical protein